MFNLESTRTVQEADKRKMLEEQANATLSIDIETKEDFNGKSFIKKVRLFFGKINMNVW